MQDRAVFAITAEDSTAYKSGRAPDFDRINSWSASSADPLIVQ
jgi:hypothetical protein